jgi:CIC family chloride channel protein
MTNNYSVILPLMAANIASYAIAYRLSPTPIYDALLMQDGLHLPHASGRPLRQVRVASAMTRQMVTLRGDWTVEEAQRHLREIDESHRAYPLLDDEGRLVGMLDAAEIGRGSEARVGGKKLLELQRVPLVHAHPDHALETVLVKLGRFRVTELPVVSRKDPRRLLGLISIRDVAEALARVASSENE